MTSQMTEEYRDAFGDESGRRKKSALDGPVNAAATMDIANELLNDMARNSGAGDVREDHSKYKVKLHLGGGKGSAGLGGQRDRRAGNLSADHGQRARRRQEKCSCWISRTR